MRDIQQNKWLVLFKAVKVIERRGKTEALSQSAGDLGDMTAKPSVGPGAEKRR